MCVCVSTGCALVGQAELTVENKSKQPSLLMTQYTSGRRGPFPVGCKRKEETGWTKLIKEVIKLATFKGCSANIDLCFCKSGLSRDKTGSRAKLPGQIPLARCFTGNETFVKALLPAKLLLTSSNSYKPRFRSHPN